MTSEADLLSELIGTVYDAALDPSLWPRALERACLFVGGSSGNLFWHDVATEQSAALQQASARRTPNSHPPTQRIPMGASLAPIGELQIRA